MPELPEVETIRKSLDSLLPGKKIKDVELLVKKQFTGGIKDVVGQTIKKTGRKGKVFYVELQNKHFLSFHLKMTGELLYAEDRNHAVFKNEIPRTGTKFAPNKFTSIIIDFTDGSGLFFNDLRQFGWVKGSKQPEVPKGIDALSKDFNESYLTKILSSTKKPIKIFLLDQEKIAGIGNIYANDSLWEAKINPERKSHLLHEKETKNLYNAIKKIIAEGIHYKGSSAKDEMYILPNGEKGGYQNHFKVYHRDGQKCLRNDNGLIKRIKQGGRSSFYCSICQK